jgi:DNA-binding NarL/FixJ family response regulator
VTPIRLVLADDHALIRAGLATLLQAQPDLDVVAEADDGAQAVAHVRTLQPDVVVMDVRMPGLDGVSATRIITRGQAGDPEPHTRVLMLTTFNEDAVVYDALRAGASGFVLKQAAVEDLPRAIRSVAAGEAWLDPAVARAVIDAIAVTRSRDTERHPLVCLTPREREILTLMAGGLSNEQIVDRLVVSLATVKTHVTRILMKTGSHGRTEAVVLAYQTGLVVPPAML